MKIDLPAEEKARHPIQVVVSRTGLAADRIRQWERRYRVVSPSRTAGGHRLYSDQQVERLRLLARAVEAGRRIRDVAALTTAELTRLVREDSDQRMPEQSGSEPSDAGDSVNDCMDRIAHLDGSGLEALLRRSASILGVSRFISQVATPLLHRIGFEWASGAIHPPHEHLASTVLRRVLTDVVSSTRGLDHHKILVVATPQGAAHELGALMIAALATAEGWAVTYLGADLPAKGVARAAEETGARGVALSIIHPAGDPKIAAELRSLREALPHGVSLIVGGQASESYAAVLDGPSCHRPELNRFADTLRAIE